MTICFICASAILALCNIIIIKKMNYKNNIYFIIGTVILNIIYILTKIYISPIEMINIFELISINMLMYLSVCDICDGEMYVVSFAIYAIFGIVASFFGSFISVILFAVIVFGILFLMQRKSKNGIGMGDVYAISCMSLFCEISEAMSIVMISLLLSLIYGLVYSLFKKKKDGKVMIKYVPFLFVVTYLIKLVY